MNLAQGITLDLTLATCRAVLLVARCPRYTMSHYVCVCLSVCADEELATPFIVVDGGLWPCCCHIKQLLEQLSSYYYGRCDDERR